MATARIKKEPALIEDIDVGMGTSSGTRTGTQVNATNLPYSESLSIAEAIEEKTTIGEADARYAQLAGNPLQVFGVNVPIAITDAANRGYVDDGLAEKPDTVQVTAALATKANISGNSAQVFNVSSPIFPALPNATETMSFEYMLAWFSGAVQPAIDTKADIATTLDTVVEHTAYTPSLPMHPATKDYVDLKVVDIGAGDMTQAEFVNASTANKAVFTTKSIGDFTSPLGISSADQVMRVSANAITDINNVVGMGIHLGVVDGMLGDLPPASAGTNISVEQLVINRGSLFELEAVTLVGQRATTDQGYFTRFGDGTTYGIWSKAVSESDLMDFTYDKQTIDLKADITYVDSENNAQDATIALKADTTYVDATIAALHPIGSVVLRMDVIDPATIYGGTWELITGDASLSFGDGTVQDGIASGENTPLNTLAEHSHSNTAVFAGSAMADHTHTMTPMYSGTNSAPDGGGASPRWGGGTGESINASSAGTPTGTVTMTNVNAGTSGATLDVRGSRITINVWQRTA